MGVGFLTVFDNIHKERVISYLMYVEKQCPHGVAIFSLLTPVNVDSLMSGGGGGVTFD